MNIFDRVQKLIKEQGLTVKQLERECDLANATIRRWETQTPNIESVRRVAHRLNVSTDYLITGESPDATTHTLTCDGIPLSELESDLIAMYRCLPMEDQEEIFAFTKFKYNRQERKKGSSFSAYTGNGKTKISDPEEGESTSGIA